MSIRNLILGVNSITVSYLIRYASLLQNATSFWLQNATEVYYKMGQVFYYKIRQKFITKCVRFFITKCDSFITKCDSYYKMRRFYYKIPQLLQNATFIKNCDSTEGMFTIFIHATQYCCTGKKIFLIIWKTLQQFTAYVC